MTGVPRLLFRLMLDRRVRVAVKLVPLAAVAYLVSPFDVVPDIIPGFGQIDDVLVIVIAVALFLVLAPRDVVAEHIRSGRRGQRETADEERRRKGKVIEGEYRLKDDDEDSPG
jgi:uncharacterized membrane protein YkvA (DUF1232 family)